MRVRLDLDAVRHNTEVLRRRVSGDVVGVVKGVNARREVVEAFLAAGVERLAVSRPDHLVALRDVDAETVMLRIPAPSELPVVVANADVTLHGSPAVVRAASEEALRQGVTHAVLPMVDAGEGREGVPLDRAQDFLALLDGLDGVEFDAVGVNLGCGGDVPDPDDVHRVADRLPGYPLSVGGSGMFLVREALPAAVRRYRFGSAPLTGRHADVPIDGLRQGAVTLHADVLASRDGEAVVDVGNVSTDPRRLRPLDDVTVGQWSNEMTVVHGDVSEGEVVAFEMEYDAVATTFHSRFL